MTSEPADHKVVAPSGATPQTTITLRVAEARVEDIGHAIARLASADLVRLGARPGDVLKITGRTVAVVRAEPNTDADQEGNRSDLADQADSVVGIRRVDRGPAVLGEVLFENLDQLLVVVDYQQRTG